MSEFAYIRSAEGKRHKVQSYYIELARQVWGGSTPRERKRWLRRDPLVYSILKGLGEGL